ncbi:MAG: hypothetical protein AAF480_00335 [Actinomycetota bacterium]
MTTPPLPPAPEATESGSSRTKLWIGGAAAAALTLGIAVPVMAESGGDEPPLTQPASNTVVMSVDELAEMDADGMDGVFAEEIGLEDLTDEDIAEINAETDALVAHLADNGVTVEVETDDNGLRFPVLDDADEATWDLVDQYYEETYGDLEFDDIDFELTDEDIAEINAETDAIVAHLADNGVTVEVETDEDGVRWPAIDDADEATWALVDQYFVDTYGEDFEILEGCDFDEDEEFGEDGDDLAERDADESDVDESDVDEDEGDA